MPPSSIPSAPRAAAIRIALIAVTVAFATFAWRPPAAKAGEPLTAGPIELEWGGATSLELVGRLDASTPTEQPDFLTRLNASAAWPGKVKFSSTTSFFFDGTIIDPENKHVVKDFDHVFQDTNPSLDFEEAYVDIFLPNVDLRVGKQRFAWGKLDAFNPNDVLNPLDYTRPVSAFENLMKIGVPAVRVDLFPPSVIEKYLPEMFSVEGVWIPFAVPYRLPMPEERWFPPLLRIPSDVTVSATDVGGGIGTEPVLSLGINATYSDVRLPERDLRNSQYAAMVTAHVGRADLMVSYFDGYDRLPTAEITGFVRTTCSGLLSRTPHVDVDVDIRMLLDRIRTVGAGISVPVWDFTVKGDFAYVEGRVANFDIASPKFLATSGIVDIGRIREEFERNFPTQRFDQTLSLGEVPISVQRNFFASALQIEYITGDWVFDVAAYEDVVFDWQPGLINPRYDTKLVAVVRRTLFDQVVTIEAPILMNAVTVDVLTSPQVTYALYDDLKITGGMLFIWGANDHLLGQYHRNDQLFAKLELSF